MHVPYIHVQVWLIYNNADNECLAIGWKTNASEGRLVWEIGTTVKDYHCNSFMSIIDVNNTLMLIDCLYIKYIELTGFG